MPYREDSQPANAEAWTAFRQWMEAAHPKGGQVVDRARARGCKLSDCFGVTLDGPANVIGGFPIAYFGERETEYLVIQPDSVSVYRAEPRG